VPELIDRFGRVARDLRVSLTDKCNLRCTYCMPPEGVQPAPGERILTDAAVVTGSRLIDPRRTYGLCDERTPHLLAWVEEVDACVGPLVEPGAGACAACAYHARCEADGAWANLASQAALARPIGPTPAVRDLASALGARAVMGFLEGAGNTLHDVQWRVPQGAQAPYLVSVPAHPSCGCIGDGFDAPDGA